MDELDFLTAFFFTAQGLAVKLPIWHFRLILTIFRAPTEIQNCDSMSPNRGSKNYWPENIPIKIFQSNEECGKRLHIWFRDNFSASTASIKLHVAQISGLSRGQVDEEKKKKKRRKKSQTFFVAAVCRPECTWERMQVGRLWVFLYFFILRDTFSRSVIPMI